MKIEISGKRLETVTGRINLEFISLPEINTTVKEATLDGIEQHHKLLVCIDSKKR